MELQIRDMEHQVKGNVTLQEIILQTPRKTYVVWEAVRHELARRRRGTHKTKTRGEVRGGGRKPWVQKGTGRARHGSIRSPLWVGGGTVHGPQPRSYDYHFPRKKTKLAYRIVMAERLRENKVYVFESLAMNEPKTKEGVKWLSELGLQPGKDRVLIVDREFQNPFYLSLRNIPKVILKPLHEVTIYELTLCDTYIFSQDAFESFIRMCEP